MGPHSPNIHFWRSKAKISVEIMEEHSRVLIEDLMRLGTAEGYQSCLSVKDRNRAAHSNAQIRKQTELMRNLDEIEDIEKAREDCFESDRWDGERRVRDVFQEEERMLNRFLQWVFSRRRDGWLYKPLPKKRRTRRIGQSETEEKDPTTIGVHHRWHHK